MSSASLQHTVVHLVTLKVVSFLCTAEADAYEYCDDFEEYTPEAVSSLVFRSTSKSRPNNIRGEKCPSVRPSIRPSVRPQKVSSI